ncbi:MAG: 23S rRNA (adenine(2503)-C(2))-methyltransferase RlmN [Lachnospiraceae bacterium]|nr:23S rRNA (adenine(2503)-C(2))-methyltransferase RlmN [Lachnospiraceae bacterium]
MTEKTDIKSRTIEELKELLCGWGEKPFRAGQIFGWLHEKKVSSYDEMTNVSKALREKMETECVLTDIKEIDRLESADGTKKFLFELADGQAIESVLMKYHHGNSVCISSQAGCRMGCRFCASTLGGLIRNLSASEMLEQIYEIERITGEPVSNVVVMGTGEPMDNYENFVRFVRILSAKEGKNLSVRNITVSTCGIVEGIKRLAEENLPLTLALSLHAPNDGIRKQLMPVAHKYKLEEVLAACDYYYEKTSRRITYEYSLVEGVNDSEACAKELAARLKGKNCHVNLIPVNPIKERDYKKSRNAVIQNFKNTLEKKSIPCTIRREMGSDINAACGQLRRSHAVKGQTEREGE